MKLSWIDPRVESDELRAQDGGHDEVIDARRPCCERGSRAGRELQAPQASVAVSAARERQRLQRFALRERVGGQGIVDVIDSACALVVPSRSSMRMPRTLSPSQRPEMTRASDVSDVRSTWLRAAAIFPTERVVNHGLWTTGFGRRRPDDECERVDEIVGIDPGVKSDQLRAFDRKRRLMVEAAGCRR